MRIIPVIDLKGGIVVRGVGGRREEYRPVQSVLAPTANPLDIAAAFRDRLGFQELYLADLDAIGGAEPAWGLHEQLLLRQWRIWLDAGVGDAARARRLAEFACGGRRLERIIVGLESLRNAAELPELLDTLGPERLTLSLDLMAGRPVAADPRWRQASPERIAAEALELGVRSLIVLDLAYVGEGQGLGVLPRCAAIRELDAKVELVSGGGVRSADDLRAMAAAGCDAALVASALHDGRLT
jgi:phosphoribosylformimino-5-aminoimidazole carboxamide ribotide isomerase